MKKAFKLFMSIFIMTVMFLGITESIKAIEVPESVKLTGSVPMESGYNLFTVEPGSGTHAYCLDITNEAPADGNLMNLFSLEQVFDSSTINRIIAVIRTSEDPYYDFGLSELDSFYVTQSALWYAENGSTPMHDSMLSSSKYGAAYGKLMNAINDANNGRDFTKENVSISVSASNGLSEATHVVKINGQKYLLSDSTFTVNSPGTYTVNVEGGFLADSNGNNTGKSSASYDVNDSFKILIPVNKEGSISASFNVTTDSSYVTGYQLKGYKYSDDSLKLQRLALLFKTEDKLSTSYTVKGEYVAEKKADIKIAKVDTEGKLISGAKLGIYSGSKLIGSYDSTTDYIKVTLKPGNYSLKEISAPEGYQFSNAEVKFSIDEKGNVKDSDGNVVVNKTFLFENSPIPKTPDTPNGGGVVISKKDFTTGKEIEGAHLAILHEDGTPVYQNGEKLEWISGKTEKQFEMLPEGKYILVETIPASGYNVEMIIDGTATSRYNFEVVNGQITRIDVYNEVITDVPVTGMSATSLYIIGGMIILAGFATITVARRKEEM